MKSYMIGDAIAPAQKINMLTTDIDGLFEKYEAIGFLYPAKKRLLKPHFTKITANWKNLCHSREKLLWALALTDQKTEKNYASISVWKQSNFGLFAQHLVSSGNPFLSLKVMLQAQHIAEFNFTEQQVKSSQNWFRPNNRYAYRVFASMFEKLGAEKASLIRFQYLHLPLEQIVGKPDGFSVEDVTGKDKELIEFVKGQYGNVFVRAEELDQEDIQLRNMNKILEQYQLNICRNVFKIRCKKSEKVIGAVVANRAPLGLNFSFLENRSYYILDKNLSPAQRTAVIQNINCTLKSVYQGFPLKTIPIVTDLVTSEALKSLGANHLREYMQSIWLREGFRQWYEHIQSFLKRIESRMK